MGKFKGMNSKAAAAKERKDELKAERQRRDDLKKELKAQEEWKQGANLRYMDKKKEEERRQAEKEAKRLEKLKLMKEEEKEMGGSTKPKKKKEKVEIPPWEAALADGKIKPKWERNLEMKKKAEAKKKREEEEARRRAAEEKEEEEGGEDEFQDDLPAIPQNTNRTQKDFEDASGIDAALSTLSGDTRSATGDDRFVTKRMKALYKAYEEANLPRMKEEYPGLKLSQYKEKIFESWKRSPENPMAKR